MTTDEIYERYLRKAITEINRLSHEVAQAADGAPTALPTGHPLASIFLLKYGPQAPELQEGVAFHGRAGNALIKSLQRLHVDPMEVYGTNAVKFAGCDLTLAAELLRRELRIVEPKLLVVMGEDALEFLNGIAFPLVDADRDYAGRAAALHADDRGARRPRHRLRPRRGPCKDRVLERLQSRRPLVGRSAALLGLTLFGLLVVYYETSTQLWQAGTWWDVAWLVLVLIPAVFSLVLLALPLRRASAGCCRPGSRSQLLAAVLTIADVDVFANFARLGGDDAARLVVPRLLRGAVVGRARRLHHPVGRRLLGLARADEAHHREPRARLRRPLVRLPGARSSTRRRTSACPTCCSSRSSSPRPRVSACGCARRSSRCSSALGVTIAATVYFDLSGLPALPGLALGFLLPNADLMVRGYEGSPGPVTART